MIYGDFGLYKKVFWSDINERGKNIGCFPKQSTLNVPRSRRNKSHNGARSAPAVATEGAQPQGGS